MENRIDDLKKQVLDGSGISFDDAMELYNVDDSLCNKLFDAANEIRTKMAGNTFHLCSILNAKSGNCSENCKFCAQSAHYNVNVENYSLITKEEALVVALDNQKKGINNFSLVTSGKGPNKGDIEKLSDIYKYLKANTELHLCASHGVIDKEDLQKLKDSGVEVYHHNLEAGPDYFSKICTTHSYEDRINTIKNVQSVGLKICSGGIIGMGESFVDRVQMAFDLKKLEITSVPINILNPVKGTPMEDVEFLKDLDVLKTIAIFRFILPDSSLRYAGGRQLINHIQNDGLKCGINAALVGDLLTTLGSSVSEDMAMIKDSGYQLVTN